MPISGPRNITDKILEETKVHAAVVVNITTEILLAVQIDHAKLAACPKWMVFIVNYFNYFDWRIEASAIFDIYIHR